MDPCLERPAIWPGVHARLAGIMAEILVPQLRPRYVVDLEHRVYVLAEGDPSQRHFVPDLAGEVEVEEARLVVREREGRALVTVLEILSPANKTEGSRGR
jgi:hypothetical protein